MAFYPFCLRSGGRQEGKCFAPERAGAGDVAGCFTLFGFGGERVQPLCVDQGVAARAGTRTARERRAAGGAVCGSSFERCGGG